MATGYNVRVGDADRDAVAIQLREHFADGRLTLDELNERLDQTFAAKTKADLNTVMHDLPHAARPAAGTPYGGRDRTTATARVTARARAGRAPSRRSWAWCGCSSSSAASSCSAVSVAAAGRWRSCCSSRPWRWSGG